MSDLVNRERPQRPPDKIQKPITVDIDTCSPFRHHEDGKHGLTPLLYRDLLALGVQLVRVLQKRPQLLDRSNALRVHEGIPMWAPRECYLALSLFPLVEDT